MTSPNEWWKEYPFATFDGYVYDYDIEAIIEEVKRRERFEDPDADIANQQ